LLNVPKYEEYSLLDLYHVLNSIKDDVYPDAFDTLERELKSRKSTSVVELEDCYFILDRQKRPEHAKRLLKEIDELGGFLLHKPFERTDESKYRTFWWRFWARVLDGFVIGLPLIAVQLAMHSADIPAPAAYFLIDLFVIYVYYIGMHARYGQTVGKMAMRIKLWDKSESREITLAQSIMREIVPLAFSCVSLIYFLGFGMSDDGIEMTETAKKILLGTGVAVLVWWIAGIATTLLVVSAEQFTT